MATINRYAGNSGRVVRVPAAAAPRPRPARAATPAPERGGEVRAQSAPASLFGEGALGGALGGVLGKLRGLANIETEDLLLVLVLYLLYRESGDKELLIILAAMLLM